MSQEVRQGRFWISLVLGNRTRTRMKEKKKEGEKMELWVPGEKGDKQWVEERAEGAT